MKAFSNYKYKQLLKMDSKTGREKFLTSPIFQKTNNEGWATYQKLEYKIGALYITTIDDSETIYVSENGGLGDFSKVLIFMNILDTNSQEFTIDRR